MPRAVHAATLDVSSLAPSSTMMSCTVHSPMDSLAQPSCTVVYIVCNPAPRGSPFELSLGLRSKLPSPTPSPPSQSSCVCWFLVLWTWVASLELESKPSTRPSHTRSSSLVRQLYPDSRVKELLFHTFHLCRWPAFSAVLCSPFGFECF